MSESPSPPDHQPPPKRAFAFFDGQNLFHSAQEAFGYDYPNYHPVLLSESICRDRGWSLRAVRFYTGVHKQRDNFHWHNFWAAKKRNLSRDKRVHFYTRDLQSRRKPISFNDRRTDFRFNDGTRIPLGTRLLLPNGRDEDGDFYLSISEEKGIDVRIALEMIRFTYRNEFDVGIIFSQDQDLSEAITEIWEIAKDQNRRVEMYSAFPFSNKTTNQQPIRGTTEIQIDEHTYNRCLDKSHYHRPR